MKISHKKTKLAFVAIFAGTAIVAGLAVHGEARVQTAVGSDVSAMELRSITIESWDRDYSGAGYGWEVRTNRDTRVPGAYNHEASNMMSEREVKLIEGTPQDIRENIGYDEARVLGVNFAFTFPGNNVVYIKPPRVDHYIIERPREHFNEMAMEEGFRQPACYDNPALNTARSGRAQAIDCVNGVEMPGQVEHISVWVLGRGNQYDLEAWIEDWKGETHILRMGSVDFVGWRPLSTRVPANIPQEVDSFPMTKNLVFKQLVLRSRPNTSLEPVYIFFDELRVLTNVFEVHFDGANIDFDEADCERKNQLLRLLRQHARNPDIYELRDCSEAPGPAAPIEGQPADDQ